MAVEFDRIAFRHGDAAGAGDAADIVAAQVQQHQMLGPFLGIVEQAGAVGGVLDRILAARAGAGDRPDRHFAIAGADQDFRAGPDQRKAGQVEIIEEGRRVDPAQCAIERDRGQGEGAGEALRQHHLEDVARDDIVLGAVDHLGVAARFQHRRHVDLGNVGRGGHGRQRRSQARGGRVDPLQRLRDRLFRVGGLILPYRGDQEQGVGQAIEHQDDGRPHEQHVRQGDVVGGGAGQLFDQAHSLIAEIADQTGERGRQGGVQIGAAFGDQCAQRL